MNLGIKNRACPWCLHKTESGDLDGFRVFLRRSRRARRTAPLMATLSGSLAAWWCNNCGHGGLFIDPVSGEPVESEAVPA